MEYLDGGDVKNYIKSNSEHLDKLLKDILAALSYLHANGIIHRDLKPQNILIKQTPTGPIAKITDFGISKTLNSDQHTSSSVLLGSIEYMAPEQFNPEKYGINGKINTNVDLWSFGCLTYELVTGESVFGNRSGNTRQEEVMSKILTGDIVLKIGQLSDPYRQIVERCLVKNADQRARNAKELIKLFAEKDCDVGSFNETQIIRTTPNQIRETVPIE
jgi:serine/threonine protein kinase